MYNTLKKMISDCGNFIKTTTTKGTYYGYVYSLNKDDLHLQKVINSNGNFEILKESIDIPYNEILSLNKWVYNLKN